jgi:hypothetical protein
VRVTEWIPFDTFVRVALKSQADGRPPLKSAIVSLSGLQTTDDWSNLAVVLSAVDDLILMFETSALQSISIEK